MDKIYKNITVRNQYGQFNSTTSFLKGTTKNLKSAKNFLPNALFLKGSVGQICFKIENSCTS